MVHTHTHTHTVTQDVNTTYAPARKLEGRTRIHDVWALFGSRAHVSLQLLSMPRAVSHTLGARNFASLYGRVIW